MKHTVMVVSVLLIAVAYVTMLVAQVPKPTANDPSLGTWVLNAQQSKLAGLGSKAFIERYDLRPDGFIISTRAVIASDGTPYARYLRMTWPFGERIVVPGGTVC